MEDMNIERRGEEKDRPFCMFFFLLLHGFLHDAWSDTSTEHDSGRCNPLNPLVSCFHEHSFFTVPWLIRRNHRHQLSFFMPRKIAIIEYFESYKI